MSAGFVRSELRQRGTASRDAWALMNTPRQDSSRWWSGFWSRGSGSPEKDADLVVDMWKAAWIEGAHARWAPHSSGRNPHRDGMERAAWDAGWDWAGRNPDRRSNSNHRLAHRHRRASDSMLVPTVRRAVSVGAAGVTLYAISKAFG